METKMLSLDLFPYIALHPTIPKKNSILNNWTSLLKQLCTCEVAPHDFKVLEVDSGGRPEEEGSEEGQSWINGVRRRG